ncbi:MULTISPECIES: dTDP-glucose 4,6-dehydratase [Rhodomicrobium]|uniref:dTDP-glucose 4,6-dehydratase n=1 Tax=Rhodomicrobium TaxID=1068 RepID=UPI000B4A8495|nr:MULTISPECIES: dTDP-glucose 4,6-dehydratase [Rhodomicrobium]
MKILVTGGCGFIGSAVIRHAIRRSGHDIVNLDKLTYAATPEALEEAADDPRHVFERADICDADRLRAIFERHRPNAVLHLAAETHVDRSIDGPADFVTTNVFGTFTLLQTARAYFETLTGTERSRFRFLHVSTDEVFGSLGTGDPGFTERSTYAPRSPYSASKAASDHFAAAWGHTFGVPVIITNCSNNYGPWQFPEKLIPLMLLRARKAEVLPVYGRGDNIRDWLHVDDHAAALWSVLERGRIGESYMIGGNCEHSNIAVVEWICEAMDRRFPEQAPHARLIRHVEDRPGHDLRYAIDAGKIRAELGWTPARDFRRGLDATIDWYLGHESWWRGVGARVYGGQRLGLVEAIAS